MNILSRLTGRTPRASEFQITDADRFVVLAPHADDETLGAGGLMALAAKAGCEIAVLVLTDGAKLRLRPQDEGLSAGDLVEARRRQCRAALKVLGVEQVGFLDAADGHLASAKSEIAREIAETVNRVRPSKLFIPHPQDRHRDHRACLPLVKRSLGLADRRRPDPLIVLGYEIWLPCQATHCLDISEVIEQKKSALECYRETFRSVDLMEMITGLNRYRAGVELTRSGWCEAFRRLL